MLKPFMTQLVLAIAASTAGAQWTVTNLHPAGASESSAYGVGLTPAGVREVGYAGVGGAAHAALWSGTAAGWTDLHVTGLAGSVAYGVSGNQQVGAVYFGSTPFAAAWSGSAGTWQDLGLGTSCTATCINNGLVGGTVAVTATSSAACEWVGTTRTLLSGSGVTGISAGVRVGSVRTGSFPIYGSNALMWPAGSSASVTLHPAGAYASSAYGVSGAQQVGTVKLGSLTSPLHASLWTGSAASWVDLHPAVATSSECRGVSGGVQVGFVMIVDPNDPNMNSVSRASLWTGSATSWVNLHSFLPSGFATSAASGVYSDGQATVVCGYGFNNATGRTEALLWVSTPTPACGSADFNCDGDIGTDADIEGFFACLAGSCPAAPCTSRADFNGDHDVGTDADIEAFFRVLAGGSC